MSNRATVSDPLGGLITDILTGGDHFLSGVQNTSRSISGLLAAVVQWGFALKRTPEEISAVFEPCLRQSIVMSLVPAKAVDPDYLGSIDDAISEHLAAIGLSLSADERLVLRDICFNIRRLHGLTKQQARLASARLAKLRSMPQLFTAVKARQNERCIWCGVEFRATGVVMSLEHVTPKLFGDDPNNGTNWALACTSCNQGKANTFAWAAAPYAHDFIERSDLSSPKIGLSQRWSVLMRDRECFVCKKKPKDVELWVYKRISTGLLIPSNCGVACGACTLQRRLSIPAPNWDKREVGRVLPGATSAPGGEEAPQNGTREGEAPEHLDSPDSP